MGSVISTIKTSCSSIVLAWLFLFHPLCLGMTEAEVRLTLPSSSKVVETADGALIEIRLSDAINSPDLVVAANSILLFRNGELTYIISPAGAHSKIHGNEVLGGLTPIYERATRRTTNVNDDDCPDNKPWLRNIPLPEGVQPTDLAFEKTDLTTGQISKDLVLSNFRIPAGSWLQIENGHIVGFYSSGNAMLGQIILPNFSVVHFLGYAISVDASEHEKFELNGFTVDTRTPFNIWSNGDLWYFVSSADRPGPFGGVLPKDTVWSVQDNFPLYVALPVEAPIYGIKASANRAICLDRSGWVNMRLAQDAVTPKSNVTLPKGSDVVIDEHGVIRSAILYSPIIVNNAEVAASRTRFEVGIKFYDDGTPKEFRLAKRATIGGYEVDPGYVSFYQTGALRSAIFANNEVISDRPIMAGKFVEFNTSNLPIRFTTSKRFVHGNTTIEAGGLYNGTFSVSGSRVALPPDQLRSAIDTLIAKLVDQTKSALQGRSGKFPFGNMGSMNGHDFRYTYYRDHVDIHAELWVESFFNNPPFSDCDGNISADTKFFWNAPSFNSNSFQLWIGPITGTISHGVCPGTKAIEIGAEVGKALGLVRYSLSFSNIPVLNHPLFERDFAEKEKNKISEYLSAIYAPATVPMYGIEINGAYIEGNQFKIDYSYSVVEH